MINNKVRPFVGDLRLNRLSTVMIQQAMNDYSKSEAFKIE